MSDDDLSENLRQGSDNIVEGVRNLKDGIQQYTHSLSIWFGQHPLIKNAIILLISVVVSPILAQMLTQVHLYLFGAIVPISRDVKVEAFPAPIGFTLWVLSFVFILFILQAYFKFISLRQRIENIESKIKND